MVLPGERFGNYEVIGDSQGKVILLSETVDSVTVRARHLDLDSPAALKIIHHAGQGKSAFEEESEIATAAAGLSHRYIVRVVDFGTTGDRLYRAMEWCDGGNLGDYLVSYEGSKREEALLEWFHQCATALAHAHQQGILHRDLKPANVLIAKEGAEAVAKIADFGFAGAAAAGYFAAPEQADGEVTAASDVYSLAAVFSRLWDENPSISTESRPQIPAGLDSRWKRILGPMLAEHPEDRPANGKGVLSALRFEFPDFSSSPIAWSAPIIEEKVSEAEPAVTPVTPVSVIEDLVPPPLPSIVAPEPEPEPPPIPLAAIPEPPALPKRMEEVRPAYTPPPPVSREAPPESPQCQVWGAPASSPSPRPAKSSFSGKAVAALVVLATLAGGGFFAWRHFSKPEQAPSSSQTGSLSHSESEPPTSEEAPTPQTASTEPKVPEKVALPTVSDSPVANPVVPPAELTAEVAETPVPPNILKVPGDATTIGGALARCPSDGTIEINGGVYRESLLITRPVTILASGDATLEDDGKSPTLLIAKGEIAVSIRGLVMRNSQAKGAGNPEEAPALMLIASGARVKMNKCTIEGGQGDGLTLADHGHAELSECRLIKNRGFGTRISGGSSMVMTQGSIQENGLGGVWVSNSGTRLSLNEGGTINRNSNNGIQVTDGAGVEINGGGVSFNRTNGIIALDAGTKVEVKESGLVSDNGVNGIAIVNGAAATITSAKIERNQNHGVLAERSGKLVMSGAVLRSNALAGIFFNEAGGQTCRIERSEFSDHSEFGAAFVEADIFVSGCTFSENGGALLLGKDTKGEISGNSISPGPLEKAILREEAGEVKESKNTVR